MVILTMQRVKNVDYHELIKENLGNTAELERLYREEPVDFSAAMDQVYEEHPESVALQVWHHRLHYQASKADKMTAEGNQGREIRLVVILSLLAGTALKILTLPAVSRHIPGVNITFIPFLALCIYFAVRGRLDRRVAGTAAALFLFALVYVNLLAVFPGGDNSQTRLMAEIHLPFFLWILLGVFFAGDQVMNHNRRMDYLKYNGEVLIFTAMVLLGGVVMTALTLNLFQVIGVNIERFYLDYVVLYGLAASPIVATYLTRTRSQVARNIAPQLAKIFSPLVLVTLVIYLLTMVVLKKSPYIERDVLITFNGMLLGVLAIVVFTLSERDQGSGKGLMDYITFALVCVTLLVDLVALSAILFRLASYGLTPNRLVVLGANLIIFVHLAGVLLHYLRFFRKRAGMEAVTAWLTGYVPVYGVWAALVTFMFPIIFRFQ